MKFISRLFVILTLVSFTAIAEAQESVWVQVEAQPNLQAGQARARAYAGRFGNVRGFAMRSGWYAVVLGPYSESGAQNTLQRLQAQNLIPADSYITSGRNFVQQVWPVGASPRATPPATAPTADPSVATALQADDETPRQARASEAGLTRDEREILQSALKWEGLYDAAIDGAFGRGTRAAMSAWQQSAGYEPTGVLTTRQRAELLDAYNTVLEGIGLQTLRSEEAGIEISVPAALVEFDRFEPPFVHYSPKTEDPVRVLLISQIGTRGTLYSLYDVMQTLEIVPLEGERERSRNSFELSGQDEAISSYTYAALDGGMIKGFTLVWPAGDGRRMQRVAREMRASFAPFGDYALDETLGGDTGEQRIDLVSGLDIRQPDVSRSGFFVDSAGMVLTTTDVVAQCREITLERNQKAELVFANEVLGIAVLRPVSPLSPIAYANFRQGAIRIQSEVAVAGYPYEGVLNAPTLTYGRLADVRGLGGEDALLRLSLSAQPGDAGGPVFDASGGVIGMLLPKVASGERRLPEDVSFSANAAALEQALSANGLTAAPSGGGTQLAPEDLATLAADMTVLVSCWN